jgi:hypothetical protein
MLIVMLSIDQLNLPRYLDTMPSDYELYIEYGYTHFPIVKKILYRTYLRSVLSERQNHRCCYCGLYVTDIVNSRRQSSLEHVIPESMGGATDLWNCVVAHRKCNTKRQCTYIPEQEDVVFGRTNDEQFVTEYGKTDDPALDSVWGRL